MTLLVGGERSTFFVSIYLKLLLFQYELSHLTLSVRNDALVVSKFTNLFSQDTVTWKVDDKIIITKEICSNDGRKYDFIVSVYKQRVQLINDAGIL